MQGRVNPRCEATLALAVKGNFIDWDAATAGL
jgi:hypothetical protein